MGINLILTANANPVTVSGGGWQQLAAGHYEPAVIALEVIAPKAGLSTANRYYKAYPGIEYRVPIVVLGGAYPFKYELLSGPSGMYCEPYGSADYGDLVWPNPTTSGSPHSVSIKVTDQEGNSATVSWTITVTTSGFLFVDASSGSDSNAGTLAAPFATINGWYKSNKYDGTYAGYFVYYRAGTYRTDSAPREGGVRMTCSGDLKPKVHLGYPGETVTLDLSNSYWSPYGDSSANYWWSGFRVTGISASSEHKGFRWDSGSAINDITFYLNTVAQQTDAGVDGQNSSILMSANGGSTSNRIAIVRNTFEGLNNRDLFLGYYCNKGVVERNVVGNGLVGRAIYLKFGYQYWSIRNNVGLAGNTCPLVQLDTYSTAADVEVCWNNYKTTVSGMRTSAEFNALTGPVWDYRNTWQVSANVANQTGGGNWYATRNVIVHDGTQTQGYGNTNGGAVTFTRTELLAATSGLVDSAGLLTGSDRTNYLGVRGHEVA